MKILYITVPSFFDLEISLIRELSKYSEVKVIMILTPNSIKSSAFNIDSLSPNCELIQAKNYPQILKYKHLINLDNWIISNNPSRSIESLIRTTIKVKNYINEYNPDVIHYTNLGFYSLGSILAAKKSYRKILTLHDVKSHAPENLIKRLVRYLSIHLIKNTLLLSKPSIESERNLRKICKNIWYSSLGPYDYLNTYETSQSNFMIPSKYILFFGRIQDYKGVDILIDSYERSKCKLLGYKLIIAGKGNLDIVDNDDILFYNRYITNDELSLLIEKSQFVVLPYKSATQSGVIMSAFAKNKPVIATKVGDFVKVIGKNKYGYLVNPNDVDELKNGIDYLILNPDVVSCMSKNIANDYSNCGPFGWNKIASNLINIYSQL